MSIEWLVIRGSGLAAFAMLGLAVIWGLLISTRVLGKAAKPKPVSWFHESLSVGALIAAVIHLVALGLHDYVDFTWVEVLVPGVAHWRPTAVALGVIAFYALVVVTLSFYVKLLIGHRAWRAVHTLSFGLYVTALAHGIAAGTDNTHPLVVAMYAGFTTATLILVVLRVTTPVSTGAQRPPPRARARLPESPATRTLGRAAADAAAHR